MCYVPPFHFLVENIGKSKKQQNKPNTDRTLRQNTQKILLASMHHLITPSACLSLRGGGKFGLSSPGLG
jgi:hypothetical protein